MQPGLSLDEQLDRADLKYKNNPHKACSLYRKIIEENPCPQDDDFMVCNPRLGEAHNRIGMEYRDRGKYELAKANFLKALAIDSANAEAHFNLSLLLLLLGEYERGWQEYEWRWKINEVNEKAESWISSVSHEWKDVMEEGRKYPHPKWDGNNQNRSSILIHHEQGRGDQIQFARYARLVKEKNGDVIMTCIPCLKRLLETCPDIDEVHTEDFPLSQHDFDVPLMSLPLIFKTTLDTIPSHTPYFFPSDHLRPSESVLHDPLSLKIGIVWSGSSVEKQWPLEAFRELSLLPVKLIGIQYEPKTSDVLFFENELRGVSLHSYLTDFVVTGSIINCLDLVISVDTAVAHLAGSLHRPVWVVLKEFSAWQWGAAGHTTPWYPTMRLFRQSHSEDWTGPIHQIVEAISPPFDTIQTLAGSEWLQRGGGHGDDWGDWFSAWRREARRRIQQA